MNEGFPTQPGMPSIEVSIEEPVKQEKSVEPKTTSKRGRPAKKK